MSAVLLRVRGVNVHHLTRKPGLINYLQRIIRTKRFIREIQPDILNAHYASGTETFASALSRHHPFIVTTYGSDILHDTRSLIKRLIVKYVLRKADVVTIEGEHIMDKLIGLGVDEKKTKYVCFGTDTEMFSQQEPFRSLKKHDPTPVVISLRSLKPLYMVDTLIKAIPIILREIPDARFIIAGDGPEKERLQQLVSSLYIQDHVSFVGSISHDEMPRWLTESDVYVSTSSSDSGLASSTAEAMSCELPVVITDVCDNRKWIIDAGFMDAGFVYPPGDYQVLAERIIYLLKNKELRMRLGGNGRQVIIERHEYNKEMEKVESIYKGSME
jgi:glycosyltransferase involved in cell wall biosynthesis